ncbi:hypothetical protein GCM10028826_08580 [Mucilaginibacter boryungensis]
MRYKITYNTSEIVYNIQKGNKEMRYKKNTPILESPFIIIIFGGILIANIKIYDG